MGVDREDYGDFLNKGENATYPLLLASPVGLTVYSSVKHTKYQDFKNIDYKTARTFMYSSFKK